MKRFVIVILVLAVLGVGAFIIIRGIQQAQAASSLESAETITVTRGSLDLTAAATGSLAANRQSVLSMKTAGTVAQVLVAQGERVEAGQILVKLDTSDLELSIKQAELSVQSAEASLARASKGASEQDLAAARAAVTAAQANLNDLDSGPSEADIRQAELAIDQAKNSLWAAQGNRDSVNASPISNPGQKASAEAQVLNAEIQVQVAQMNLEKLQSGVKYATRQAALNQLAQAQASLARLQASPSDEDLLVSQTAVEQARLNLEIATNKLKDTVLAAPFSGLLADWNLRTGDTVVPSTAVGVLVDDSVYYIDVTIDETEVGNLLVGQQVIITIDSFADTPITGTVDEVGVIGTPAQGIVYYPVRISLPRTDLAIRPSLTASVRIITAHKDGVLMLLTRAIKRDNQGIYVMLETAAGPQRANITIGITEGDQTEIISGLEEGAQVYVNEPVARAASGIARFNPFAGQSGGKLAC